MKKQADDLTSPRVKCEECGQYFTHDPEFPQLLCRDCGGGLQGCKCDHVNSTCANCERE